MLTTLPPNLIKWWTFEFAKIVNVVDGDTVDVEVDVGFRLRTAQRVRLYGIDTPELHDHDANTREAALAARTYMTKNYLQQPCRIATHKTDDFGRWLGLLYSYDVAAGWHCINKRLVEAGYAVQLIPNIVWEPSNTPVAGA